VAKASENDDFKARLIADSGTVLKENGIEAPEGIKVKIIEGTENAITFILEQPPPAGELSDDDLEEVAGGIGGDSTAPIGGSTVGKEWVYDWKTKRGKWVTIK